MTFSQCFYRKISDVLQITGIAGGLIQMLIQFSQLNFVKFCVLNLFLTFSILFVFSTLKADLDKEVYVIWIIR